MQYAGEMNTSTAAALGIAEAGLASRSPLHTTPSNPATPSSVCIEVSNDCTSGFGKDSWLINSAMGMKVALRG